MTRKIYIGWLDSKPSQVWSSIQRKNYIFLIESTQNKYKNKHLLNNSKESIIFHYPTDEQIIINIPFPIFYA